MEAHLFLCMLAYYIEWHMRQRLIPLFQADGKGKERRWKFAEIVQRLKSIQEQTYMFQDTEILLHTQPDEEQQEILDMLDVRI